MIPDTKNWTWVIDRPCPECHFDAPALRGDQVAPLVRANATDWSELFAAGRIRPGRPDDSTWSALEYACHVRDVCRRFQERIVLMVNDDEPRFANWDQDASATEERYEEQEPALVLAELLAAAESIAVTLDDLEGPTWQRRGRRSDGAAFTVDTISRYMLHDTTHHIWDMTKQPPSQVH